jgi:hypothetical protein
MQMNAQEDSCGEHEGSSIVSRGSRCSTCVFAPPILILFATFTCFKESYLMILMLMSQVSYMILSRVSPVTHSIGNCLKRVIVIVASVIFFQNPMGTQNMIGVCLVLLLPCVEVLSA